ncbi:MAG: hypothetical protein V1779_05635 [bacterium]
MGDFEKYLLIAIGILFMIASFVIYILFPNKRSGGSIILEFTKFKLRIPAGIMVFFLTGFALVLVPLFYESINASITSTDKVNKMQNNELKENQEKLEVKYNEMTPGNNDNVTFSQSSKSVDGIWFGEKGIIYKIFQNKKFFAFQEIHSKFGLLSIGEGKVNYPDVEFTFNNVLGEGGTAKLKMYENGSEMRGYFFSNKSKEKKEIILKRN